MRNRSIRVTWLFLLVFVVVGCGQPQAPSTQAVDAKLSGTVTGNPVDGEAPNPFDLIFESLDLTYGDVGPTSPLASGLILDQMCAVISGCHPDLSEFRCKKKILVSDFVKIDAEIGLAPGNYRYYYQVVNAEKKSELAANASAVAQCLADFETLSCADPIVEMSYQRTLARPLQYAARIIPTSCQSVF